MGSFKTVKGNLITMALNGDFDLIVHGCNCRRIMGAGIAKTIAHMFPKVAIADRETDLNRIGQYEAVTLNKLRFAVINAYTQISPGKPSSKGADSENERYEAIRVIMRGINAEYKHFKIGLPQIGCGLAGLDWGIVREILEEELVDCDVTIVMYDGS